MSKMIARTDGFTLIEVLIAILILALGFLGLAGLQTYGLRNNHSANLRTQATLLAYDLTDRIRANRIGFENGFYNKPTATDHNCVWKGNAPNACTPQQMAEHDLWEWDTTVTQSLSQGVGVVCLDSTPDDGGDMDDDGSVDVNDDNENKCDNTGNVYAIKLWWTDEFDDDGNPLIKRFVTVFQP